MKDNTKLIYLEDSYKQEVQTTIESIKEKNDLWEITLSETIFYPQGGGQPSDQGIIKGKNGELKVFSVIYNNGVPIHQGKLKGSLISGEKADCQIDWNRRYKNMQLHSAGHLVLKMEEIVFAG